MEDSGQATVSVQVLSGALGSDVLILLSTEGGEAKCELKCHGLCGCLSPE